MNKIIGVDSGQIMICDYNNLHKWKQREFNSPRRYREVETGNVIEISNFEEEYTNGKTYNQAVSKKLITEIEYEKTNEFSYDGCCRETLSKDKYGTIWNNNEILAMCTSTGYGDDSFELYHTRNKRFLYEIEEREDIIRIIFINEDYLQSDYIGLIKIKSGKLLITDPCHIPDEYEKCGAIIEVSKSLNCYVKKTSNGCIAELLLCKILI